MFFQLSNQNKQAKFEIKQLKTKTIVRYSLMKLMLQSLPFDKNRKVYY